MRLSYETFTNTSLSLYELCDTVDGKSRLVGYTVTITHGTKGAVLFERVFLERDNSPTTGTSEDRAYRCHAHWRMELSKSKSKDRTCYATSLNFSDEEAELRNKENAKAMAYQALAYNSMLLQEDND